MAWNMSQWKFVASLLKVSHSAIEKMDPDINLSIYSNFNVSENGTMVVENEEKMEGYGYAIAIIALAIASVVGVGGNIITVYTVYKDEQLRNAFNMYLCNLSSADCIVGFGSLLPIVSIMKPNWSFGEIPCFLYRFVMSSARMNSFATLMWITIEMYRTAVDGWYRNENTTGHAKKVIRNLWICSSVLAFPSVIGLSSYGPEDPNLSCALDLVVIDDIMKKLMLAIYGFGFSFVVLSALACYGLTWWNLKNKPHLRQLEKYLGTRRTTTTVGIMIASSFTLWFPEAVVAFINVFGGPEMRRRITPAVPVITMLCGRLSTCCNPIIYLLCNAQVRNMACKCLGIRQERVGTQGGNENTVDPEADNSAPSSQGPLPSNKSSSKSDSQVERLQSLTQEQNDDEPNTPMETEF